MTGDDFCIALRSGIDAVPRLEKNIKLFHKSKNNYSFFNKNDGHLTCLLGGLIMVYDNIKRIPMNKKIRFLF